MKLCEIQLSREGPLGFGLLLNTLIQKQEFISSLLVLLNHFVPRCHLMQSAYLSVSSHRFNS